MVVMGAVDHHLALELGVAARQQAEDVGGLLLGDLGGHRERGGDAERHRLEVAPLRLLD
jgi:hypothetical protein